MEKGEKVGDVDPRAERTNCFTISDKARSIAGGVLEAIMHHYNDRKPETDTKQVFGSNDGSLQHHR